MIILPSITDLLEKVDCKYSLVILAAKRARQVVDHAQIYTKEISSNSVTTAINEIYEDKITYLPAQDVN